MLELDQDKCQGYGICALAAPELLSLDDYGMAVLDGPAAEAAPERLQRRAVLSCPAEAIRLVDMAGADAPGGDGAG